MATEKQIDELIEAVNDVSSQISDNYSPFTSDDVHSIVTSFWRIADALERMSPPPPKPVLSPANNHWLRKRWEEENGRPWTPEESTKTGE
jgi:hypothetical protein